MTAVSRTSYTNARSTLSIILALTYKVKVVQPDSPARIPRQHRSSRRFPDPRISQQTRLNRDDGSRLYDSHLPPRHFRSNSICHSCLSMGCQIYRIESILDLLGLHDTSHHSDCIMLAVVDARKGVVA